MSGICCICKKSEAGSPKEISFSYKYFNFTISKSGLECAECAKIRTIELFNEHNHGFGHKKSNKLVILSNGKLVVDWQLYVDIQQNARDGTYSEERANGMTAIFEALGILTIKSKGNWTIFADGPILLNPRAHIMELYFTRKEDVIAYAKEKCKDVMYHWDIRQISKIIKQEEILNK